MCTKHSKHSKERLREEKNQKTKKNKVQRLLISLTYLWTAEQMLEFKLLFPLNCLSSPRNDGYFTFLLKLLR